MYCLESPKINEKGRGGPIFQKVSVMQMAKLCFLPFTIQNLPSQILLFWGSQRIEDILLSYGKMIHLCTEFLHLLLLSLFKILRFFHQIENLFKTPQIKFWVPCILIFLAPRFSWHFGDNLSRWIAHAGDNCCRQPRGTRSCRTLFRRCTDLGRSPLDTVKDIGIDWILAK